MPHQPYVDDLRYGRRVDLGYARVSTAKQDLDRQVDALQQAGIAPERIYLDKKSGATTDRPGLRAALEYARDGDVIVVHTLDRLGRTVRDIEDATDARVPFLFRMGTALVPKDSTIFQDGDLVYAAVEDANLVRVEDVLAAAPKGD